MAIRGVYNKAEEKMIAGMKNKMAANQGWAKVPDNVANEAEMKNLAIAVDFWNPLWREKSYAQNTRWGGLIAFPTFEDNFGPGSSGALEASPELGYQHMIWMGEDWEIFKPIHVNDTFKVWLNPLKLEDVTPLDGKGPRTFSLVPWNYDVINQKDEVVSTVKSYTERIFLPSVPKTYSMPVYGYTGEEIDYIIRMMDQEEIRGKNIRWWEDVKIGEELKPAVLGPTNQATAANPTGGGPLGFGRDTRAALRKNPVGAFIPDAAGLLYAHSGRHLSDRAAQAEGEPNAFLFGVTSKFAMLRTVTNWMGDDGFIRKFHWRHIMRIAIGDTGIDQGKVVGKHVTDGEHLVDLKVWGRNLRGNVTESATVTVSLLSKDSPKSYFMP